MGKEHEKKIYQEHEGEEVKEKVEKELEELREKIAELEDKWKRAMADYRNLENRMHEQRSEWVKSANRDVLLRLLPILDTLILAHQHTSDQTLQVVITQFLDIVKGEGVTKIETIGKEFDPNLMEAISTTEGEENKVVEEVRTGYKLHEKVLRPAQVIVGSGKN